MLKVSLRNIDAQLSSGARYVNFGRTFHLCHTSRVRAAEAQASLCGCTGSSEHSLLTYAIMNYLKIVLFYILTLCKYEIYHFYISNTTYCIEGN